MQTPIDTSGMHVCSECGALTTCPNLGITAAGDLVDVPRSAMLALPMREKVRQLAQLHEGDTDDCGELARAILRELGN